MEDDLEYARQVLKTEAEAIASLVGVIGDRFSHAVEAIQSCTGRVVVTGMGKAGIIAQKISATLASTGTPSLFLHPAEAVHGDLGRVVSEDVVLALSNSGETREILELVPYLRRLGTRIVAITSQETNSLGKLSDIVIDIGQIEEACSLGLAPSASTTALLAIGDALALTVQKRRGFDRERFAFYHPAGELGRRMMKVSEVMRTGERNPVVTEETTVGDALLRITTARAGAACIIDREGRLTGIFTDGDLRRKLKGDVNLLNEKIAGVMTRSPITIGPDRLAVEAAKVLRQRRIDELPVVNERGELIGLLDVQDLLEVGLL